MIVKVSRIVIPVIILVTCTVGFLLMLAKPDEERRPLDENRPTVVEVSRVELHHGTVNIRVDGYVVPFREIDLSAEVAGRITEKADGARAGRFVTAGAMLYQIDKRDYALEVGRLKKQLEQAVVSIEELEDEIEGAERLVALAQRQFDLATAELARLEDLHERGVSTDSERDKARRDAITAENALATIENQHRLLVTRRSRLKHAQEFLSLQVEKAQHDLDRTTIVSPVDGVIVRDSVEKDDYVNVGTPLATVEDTSAVEVKCNLQMDELYWIWDQEGASAGEVVDVDPGEGYQLPPTPAKVRYRLREQDYLWKAELSRIDGVGLDERTRTVPCRVVVANPREVYTVGEDGRERPAEGGPPALVRGMYVDVEIAVTPKSRLFQVPESALRPGQKHHVIWVAVKSHELNHCIWVADGNQDDDKWLAGPHKLVAFDVDIVDIDEAAGEARRAIVYDVRNDLTEKDLVVAMPLGALRNELNVTPVLVTEDSEPEPPVAEEGQLSSR